MAANYSPVCLHIPEARKLNHQQLKNIQPQIPRMVILQMLLPNRHLILYGQTQFTEIP